MEGVGIAIFFAGYSLFAYGLGTLVGRCNAPFLSYLIPSRPFACNPDSSGAPPPKPDPGQLSSGGTTVLGGGCPKGYIATVDQFGQIKCTKPLPGGPLAPGPGTA